ncbi:MAG: hypothetical protein A2Z52_02565 [Candidatus Moranbacteria bacterium RBG_19FT_COMBO_42_6]|nr:MAG: hypothetical protein A2Z52_02565 [Candidatus Moranbacteria bacterium RBG_19FT_COMBO_42_6]
MKIKSVKLSLLILGSLVILSFAFFSYAQDQSVTNNNVFLDSDQDGLADAEEKTYGTDPQNTDTDGDGYSDGAEVTSGYDPTKPAPGDRIVAENPVTTVAKEEEVAAENNNLTREITTKVSTLINDESAGTDGEISIDDVQAIIDESLQSSISQDTLPEVDLDKINIKSQEYKKLSEEERSEKKKQDFLTYIVGVSYILSSNSPTPITAQSDPASLITSYGQQIISSITSQSPSALNSLSQSGEKVLDQLNDIEVPEELADLHIKGLQFAEYAIQLKDDLSPNFDDPMVDIVDFSKMQGFMDSLAGFGYEAQSKLNQYDVTTIKSAADELKKTGIDTQFGESAATSDAEDKQ